MTQNDYWTFVGGDENRPRATNPKNCPFCNRMVTIQFVLDVMGKGTNWIICPGCNSRFHVGDNHEHIDLWNNRPIENGLQQYLDRLIAAYQKISFWTRLLIPGLADILDEYEKKDKST